VGNEGAGEDFGHSVIVARWETKERAASEACRWLRSCTLYPQTDPPS
jgi:hypothetical protein